MTKNCILIVLTSSYLMGCKNKENQSISLQTPEIYQIHQNSTIPDHWKNPNIFEMGREEPRSDFMPFETDALAVAGQAVNSKYYQSLSGFWKYRFYPGPDYVPKDIEKSSWIQVVSEISFPGFIELKGMGKPIFKYHDLPFAHRFPEVPADSNSVLMINRSIQIDPSWKQRDVFAVFEGISCSYFVYLNGTLIGYNEDSKACSEYLLNLQLKDGANDLTLILFRWSDASYFESHNQWHLTGINRDAYLLARPKTRIADFFAKTDLKNKSGTLDLEVTMKNREENASEALQLLVEIRNDSNRLLFESRQKMDMGAQSDKKLLYKASLANAKAWSDETPHLYFLILNLKNNQGELLESIRYPLGFRSLQYGQNGLMWNKRYPKIKGAVCHEFHPTNGNILDKTWIENDADVLKLQGINAVRNNHYPFPSYWYKYMQKFGLFIMDEVNLNLSSFSNRNLPYPADSVLADIALYRTKNMFERNKNYSNIFAWSLGYQTGTSPAIQKSMQYIKQRDPIRPVAAYSNGGSLGDIELTNSSNIHSASKKTEIVYRLGTHQGNGLGGFEDSWNQIISNQRIAGGFVEDFTDQTFYMKNKSGQFFFAYGGDFGEYQSDSFRCVSGIMTSDKTPKPAVKILSHAFSPFGFSMVDLDQGILQIKNNQVYFEDTVFKYFWTIEENKVRVMEGTIANLHLKPGETRKLRLNLNGYKPKPGKYCVLNLIVNKASVVNGMFRFQDVSHQQFEFPFLPNAQLTANPNNPLHLDQNKTDWKISSNDFSLTLDTARAAIAQIRYKNLDLISSPLVPFFVRAPVDNDLYSGKDLWLHSWREIWETLNEKNFSLVKSEDGMIHIRMNGVIGKADRIPVIWDLELWSGGDFILTLELGKGSAPMPARIGWITKMPPKFGNIKWVGRGPYDGFQDRKSGLLIGEFKTTAVDFNVPLVRPQEMGIKTDLRWAAVSTFEGLSLAAYSDTPFEIMVLPFEHSALFGKYRHGVDIPKALDNTVAFSSMQMPVGDGIRAIPDDLGRVNKFRLRLKLTEDRSSTLWNHFAEKW
ncbi:MAG: hypothetical protein IPM48_03605 [Saprospiraceae bacterium]|nr:hypothetical protein [Saprospiraceae bacterium]